jgi:bifunctional non-homologous end joining protein LigD
MKQTNSSGKNKSHKERKERVTSVDFLKEKTEKGNLELLLDDQTTLALTHLDKIYWPEEGYTKFDLLHYYLEIAQIILPYLQDRPAILKRYPNGIRPPATQSETKTKTTSKKPDRGTDLRIRDGGFFQQNVDPTTAPPFLKTVQLETTESGHPVNYAVYTNLASLLYLTNLGTIAHNPWHSRLAKLDYPDYLVFDLDPHEAPFENVVQLALALRDILQQEAGLTSYIKTSGSSGLHLFVPLQAGCYLYQEAAHFAEELARLVVSRNPKISTLERRLEDRQPQQVYLDWLQNARGKAVAAAYTVRAKPAATVSTPLEWQEVEQARFNLSDFTIKTVPVRLKERGDPWADLFNQAQSLPSSSSSS